MSSPRSATRTGCEDSGETRYWCHEMSQAALTPESGVIEACGSPSALATPAIV